MINGKSNVYERYVMTKSIKIVLIIQIVLIFNMIVFKIHQILRIYLYIVIVDLLIDSNQPKIGKNNKYIKIY